MTGTKPTFTPSDPTPANTDAFIPLAEPYIAGHEWQLVKECLDTGWVSSAGKFVDRFEREVAAYVGAKHAVATVNGTSALHVALLLAGVQPGDEVLVSTLTFIAPANAVRYIGAQPVFIDVEPEYWQMDPEKLAFFLKTECRRDNSGVFNKTTGRRVRAVLPVHLLGHPCDTDRILEIAREYGLAVVEDAAESLGASYKGKFIGSGSALACFSFNGNKVITSGGGGMIVTTDPEMARRARYLVTQAKDDPIEYVHNQVGFNYRLTNIQAALGCAQLEKLDEFVSKKRAFAARYTQLFEGVAGITPMREAPWAKSAFWLFTILVDEKTTGLGSRELMKQLAGLGIQTRPLWTPLHMNPVNRDSKVVGGETARMLAASALSLPCSVGSDMSVPDRVVTAIKECIKKNR